jgi:hypothetical protein
MLLGLASADDVMFVAVVCNGLLALDWTLVGTTGSSTSGDDGGRRVSEKEENMEEDEEEGYEDDDTCSGPGYVSMLHCIHVWLS